MLKDESDRVQMRAMNLKENEDKFEEMTTTKEKQMMESRRTFNSEQSLLKEKCDRIHIRK